MLCVGDEVTLRFRPLSGQGQIESIKGDRYKVRLTNGMAVLAEYSDLLTAPLEPEPEPWE